MYDRGSQASNASPLAGREAASYLWARPAEILAEAERGTRLVVFVTRMNLMRLGQYMTVGDALAHEAEVFRTYRVDFDAIARRRAAVVAGRIPRGHRSRAA